MTRIGHEERIERQVEEQYEATMLAMMNLQEPEQVIHEFSTAVASS